MQLHKEAPRVKANLLRLYLGLRKDPVALLQQLHNEYGDIFTIRAMSNNVIVVSKPSYVKHVLIDNYDNYASRLGITPVIRGKVKTKSKSSTRPIGMELKTFTAHLLTKTAARELTPDIARHTNQKIAIWNQNGSQFVLNVYEELVNLSIKIVGSTLFGIELEERKVDTLSTTARQLLKMVHQRYLGILNPPLWFPTRTNREQRKLAEVFFNSIDSIIQKSIQEGKEGNVVKTWMKLQEQHSKYQHFGPFERQQDIVSFFIPAFETTPFVITATLYYLAKYPEAQHRIHEELDTVFGTGEPEYSKFHLLNTMRQFVSEVMRFHPSFWAFFKRAKSEDNVGGYKIPKNSLIVVSQWIMQRHKDFWNEPGIFDPFRFTELENQSVINPLIYFPFGLGKFSCIARNFAWAEIYTVLSHILQNFTVSPVDHTPFPVQAMATVQVPKGPIYVRFSKRQL